MCFPQWVKPALHFPGWWQVSLDVPFARVTSGMAKDSARPEMVLAKHRNAVRLPIFASAIVLARSSNQCAMIISITSWKMLPVGLFFVRRTGGDLCAEKAVLRRLEAPFGNHPSAGFFCL